MARYTETTTLTLNNRIYLYRLLSSELGCGKQVFITAVEEALASDRMTADDLGYESTRTLLEALKEFVKLTVFKGGRIYATIITQPEWDAALAAANADKADATPKNGKPWKRKKADKTLKPVRPKRVKRPEPEVEPEPMPATELKPVPMAESEVESEPALTPESASASESVSDSKPATEAEAVPAHGADPEVGSEAVSTDAVEPESVSASESASSPEPVSAADKAVNQETPSAPKPFVEPAISITVTYDPYTGNEDETVLASNPVINPVAPASESKQPAETHASLPNATPAVADEVPVQTADTPAPVNTPNAAQSIEMEAAPAAAPVVVPAQSPTAAAPAPAPATPQPEAVPTPATPQPGTAPAPQPRDDRPSPEALAGYPVDLSTDVYLTSDVVADLCEMLPYGTDVFGMLAEDYTRARNLELLSGTRAKVTFPLRVEHLDSTEPIAVTLKKRSGSGLRWELSKVR